MRRKILSIFLSLAVAVTMMPAMAGVSFAGEENTTVPVELVKAATSGSKAVSLSWNKVSGATKYVVYGQKCGKSYKKLTSTSKTSYKVKKIKGKKLKAHKTYKFYVAAYSGSKKLVTSKSIHFITGKTSGKYANAKSITVNPTSVTLERGKTATLKATTKIYKNKKHIKKSHGAATRYVSDNPTVASVNANGVVTANKEGTATIYVQDIGSLYCKTVVTVKKSATFKAVYNTTNGANTLTFYYDTVDHSGEGITVYEDGTTNYLFDNSKSTGKKWGYNGICHSVKSVVIDGTVANYTGLTSTAYMFYDMENAENISGAEYLNVSQVTNMANMFNEYGYQSRTLNIVPDVSEWNTGKVTNMSNMFYRYGYKSTALNAVPDVSEWNTVNVTTVTYMFYCYGNDSTALSTVPNVSRWNTGNLTNMASMFSNYGCESSTLDFTLDLSDWSVACVDTYGKMFESAATKAGKWSVTIPRFTGTQANNETHWYVGDGTDTAKYIGPARDKQFTVKTTIADVLDTVPSGFPTSDDAAWVNADGKKAYKNGDNIKVGNLTLGNDDNVTKSGNNYVCKPGDATVTFNVKDGAVESITVTDSNDSDGTYAPAPVTYTVTFDLNGITGTAPDTQTITSGEKVKEPTPAPTDTDHTFAGWYKTKDVTTGALSDPWDFDTDKVTADMTLYAKWTRTLGSIYGTNENIPKSDNNTAPDNAWVNDDEGKAFIAYSGKTSEVLYFYKKLETVGAKQLSCSKTENFTKIGDDYVLDYYLSSSFYGKYTLHMTNGKFTSVTYNGAGTDYKALSGTYTAPKVAPTAK